MARQARHKNAVLHRKIILDKCSTAELLCETSMDENDYLRMKEHLEAELRAAESVYKSKLAALETTWELAQELNQQRAALPGRERPSVSDLVLAVLPDLGKEFTKFDIQAAIEKKFPESKGTFRQNSFSGTISRMVHRTQLEVVKEESGPKGWVYRRGPKSL